MRAVWFVGLLWASTCLAESTAEKLIEAGHWKQARAQVEARLREAPDDPLANFLLSQIRNAFGERATPLPLAEKAVALDGRTAKYHRQVAEVLGVMAQHAGAIRQLLLARRFRGEIDTALALDPADTQALRDLMEFYLLAPGIAGGDKQKADTVANRIAAIDAVEGHLAKARLAEFHGRNTETEAQLRQAAETRPWRYCARIALARFYLAPAHRNPAEAETQAKEAVKLDRGRVDAYAVLAEIYTDRHDWSELETVLTAAQRETPDDLTPHYRAADRLIAAGQDPARAERYLRIYLSQDPEGNAPGAAEAHWKLGLALKSQGRHEEAVREWKHSVRLDPESKAARELKHQSALRPPAEAPVPAPPAPGERIAS
jgi:tetratricopeptide (TPR) repeat protein